MAQFSSASGAHFFESEPLFASHFHCVDFPFMVDVLAPLGSMYCACLHMASETSKESVEITERDIVFDCPHCSGELVVDKDGAGMTFDCSHCSKSVTVPQASTVRGAAAKPAEE